MIWAYGGGIAWYDLRNSPPIEAEKQAQNKRMMINLGSDQTVAYRCCTHTTSSSAARWARVCARQQCGQSRAQASAGMPSSSWLSRGSGGRRGRASCWSQIQGEWRHSGDCWWVPTYRCRISIRLACKGTGHLLCAVDRHADILAIGTSSLAHLIDLKANHGHALALEPPDNVVGELHSGQRGLTIGFRAQEKRAIRLRSRGYTRAATLTQKTSPYVELTGPAYTSKYSTPPG